MHGLAVYVKEELPFVRDVSLENSTNSYVFNRLYFTQCHFFSVIDYFLRLYVLILMLFHLKQMGFSRSTQLPMHLFLET